MAIKLLITGGTFDKDYDELTGKLYFRDTHIHEMLKLGRCRLQTRVRTVMMIDSLEMTESDRKIVEEICRKSEEEQIVITHGTDTMEETARVLGAAGLPKTIVLTGAMIPYAFGSSDGLFNLNGGSNAFSTLSLTSLVAVPSMIAGAVAGVKYQMWRLERAA
jgi:L-asparaginase